ncbi:MAG: DUF6600 domain-containing protein [Acidobacteriota bacterium]
MFAGLKQRLSRVPSRVAVAIALIAIIVGAGIAMLILRSGTSAVEADTSVEPRAARIDRVDGSVAIARVVEDEEPDWAEATTNTPVTVGDRIYARGDSRASIALTGHNFVELKPDASLDFLALEEEKTQLALRSGSALFDIGELDENEAFEVATPGGAVNFVEVGLYQIGIDGDNTVISVLSGRAQVVGLEGSEYISQGQVLTLTATSTQALSSTLEPQLAGSIVDNHYRYRYPKTYDGRYLNYDAYLADPFYYDPYRTSESYRYVPADVPGLYDLDYYGEWIEIDGYGHCWSPRVSAGWAPFRYGRWDIDPLWGMTWVSYEPWGWAPYHYGRWAFVNQRWFWVPVQVVRRPRYCPAPVAFISLTETHHIAWIPLAPGEVYVPRYYDRYFQPRYLASREVIREVKNRHTFANLNAPSAVTVVEVQSLRRGIDPRVIAKVDSREIAKHQHTIDPLEIAGVRQLAISKERARRKIRLARGEQNAWNKTVVTSAKTPSLPTQNDPARAFRIEQVSEARKRNKLKIDQTGQVVSARRRDDLPQAVTRRTDATNERQQKMAELAARSRQGDKSAQRELRQLRREDKRIRRKQSNQQQAQPSSTRQQTEQRRQMRARQQFEAARQNQAQQQQMRQQQKEQRRIVRQQQSRSVPQQQERMRKEQARVRQMQKAPAPKPKPIKRKPPEVYQQTQMEMMRQQQIRQSRERIERAQMEAARQAQRNQMKEQRRIEQRRTVMERQSGTPVNRIPVMKPPRVDQPRQQNKAQQQQMKKQQPRNRPRKPDGGE